ncbi:MAG: PDZ domain-containing protein [Lachnospiraceae bacterium]|nr:PDZ domain-containing protein [Lachnospiraceae bacterium]
MGDEVQFSQTTVTDVTEVVKTVMPSVVSVNNKYIETTSFWGQQYSSEGNSTGSGIIVGENDTELLLVTNYHVVEAAEELTVQFVDGSQVQAQIKGSDADKDLAVIAVQLNDIDADTMSDIAIATLGNSNSLTVGEPVIAIGNALGYGQSVTTGVVSALNRPLAVDNSQMQTGLPQGDTEVNTFIQTDAAINPGNSGGALLNIKGEVIGINSNKIGGSAVEGMGYAIPISDAQPIIENLMTKQTRLKVDEESKGYLGITGIDVVSEYSQIYGMPMGVYVSSVTEGTGAYEAGLVKGDIITAINGEEVKSMDDLKNELSYYTAGTTVELTIMQGSPTGYQPKTVNVTLRFMNQTP